MTDEVKVCFSGFEPSTDDRSDLYYKINRLHLKSPSQSILSATFTLTNGIIEGVIKITSTAENFVVKATDVNIGELSTKLFDRVIEKLENWRTQRFD